jgi:hypothetical protein
MTLSASEFYEAGMNLPQVSRTMPTMATDSR